jgi:hypothetical protein
LPPTRGRPRHGALVFVTEDDAALGDRDLRVRFEAEASFALRNLADGIFKPG